MMSNSSSSAQLISKDAHADRAASPQDRSKSVKSVVESWGIHDNLSEISSLTHGSRTNESFASLHRRQLSRASQQQDQQRLNAQVVGLPRMPARLGQDMELRPHFGDVSLSDEPSNNIALGATMEKMASLPEAMNMAKDALVEQSVKMQTEMRLFLTEFEQRLTSHLDYHKEALELARNSLGTGEQKDNMTELKAESQTALRKDLAVSQRQASRLDKATQVAAATVVDRLRLTEGQSRDMNDVTPVGTTRNLKKPTDIEIDVHLPTTADLSGVASTSPSLPNPQNIFNKIVQNDYFNMIVAVTIIFNTAALGVQTDLEVIDAMNDRPSNYDWIVPFNTTFLVIFTMELVLRLLAERCYFFVGPFYLWNLFDAFMVCTALLEELFQDLGVNVTFFRVVRVVRMTRTMRVLRVFRVFRDLRLMVTSILLSFKSLTWALFLMLLLIFCCAIMFCQGVTTFLEEKDMDQVDNSGDLREFYGSVPKAMLTLVMAISGGRDWYDLIQPLNGVSPAFSLLFILYTLFVIFGMLNVLTGVFVDRASELSHLDRDLVVESEKFRVEQTRESLRTIFQEADADASGYISWPEFQVYATREDVKTYFDTMDLSMEETKELFQMFDQKNAGRVHIDVFIGGCMRMKGHAKNLAVLHLQNDVSAVARKLNSIHDQLHEFVQSFAAANSLPLVSLESLDTEDVSM